MKFEKTQVFNFEGAFRGMRNPMNSWDKSDSYFEIINWDQPLDEREDVIDAWVTEEIKQFGHKIEWFTPEWEELWETYADWIFKNECLQGDHDRGVVAVLGPKDLDLAQRLIRAGTEHAKFLRQIFVSVDITAPMYWWSEFDTYKIGTTANSTSKMHKLASTPITMSCFETDDYSGHHAILDDVNVTPCKFISYLESLRQEYLKTNDIKYWKELVRWLPESWLQTRTITLSYANLRNIYFQRKSHKLSEWLQFCNWIDTLPWSQQLITYIEK